MAKFNRKIVFVFVAIVLLAIVTLFGYSEATFAQEKSAPSIIRFGMSGLGSTDQIFMEGISNIINKYTDVKTSTMGTQGGVEIMRLMAAGQLEAGFGSSLLMVSALRNQAPFDVHPCPVEAMLQWFAFVAWEDPFVTLEASGITSIEELEGKTIAIPPAGSATNVKSKTVLEAYGLLDKVKIEELAWQAGFEALKDRRVDSWVANWANFMPSANVIELESTKNFNILPIDEEIMAKIHEQNPGLMGLELGHEASPQNIPEGETLLIQSFTGIADSTVDVPEESVYKMVKAIFEHLDELVAMYEPFKAIPEICMSASVKEVPFHPGAARALKELGLWKEGYLIYGE